MKKRPPQKQKAKKENKPVMDRYDSVLIEGLRNDFKMVAEQVQMTGESLRREIVNLEEKVMALDVGVVSVKVRMGSLEARMGSLETKIDKVGVRLDHHEEEIELLKTANVQKFV